MYFSLIDLMRSPELVKKIGQDSLKTIVHNREQLIKKGVWVVKRNLYLEERKRVEEGKLRKSKDKTE